MQPTLMISLTPIEQQRITNIRNQITRICKIEFNDCIKFSEMTTSAEVDAVRAIHPNCQNWDEARILPAILPVSKMVFPKLGSRVPIIDELDRIVSTHYSLDNMRLKYAGLITFSGDLAGRYFCLQPAAGSSSAVIMVDISELYGPDDQLEGMFGTKLPVSLDDFFEWHYENRIALEQNRKFWVPDDSVYCKACNVVSVPREHHESL